MPEDLKEVQPPCLIKLYKETEGTAEDKTNPEEGEKFLNKVGDDFNVDLVHLLNKYTQGHKGLSLVHTLRAAHISMAAQLGLVEGWMASELAQVIDLDPQVIHAERGEQLQSGFDHAHQHLCTAHDHGDPHAEDDEDDEDGEKEPMVH